MDYFEQKEILDTFRIIIDTREQNTPRASERYKSFGVPVERAVLDYGDYCGLVTIDGAPIYDTATRIRARCVVERKMSLDELAMCFTRDRDRFRKEFQRASDNNAKVYLLVENGSWEAILNHRYRSRLHPNAFMATLTAWTVRYNIVPIFCKAGTSGKLIKELLYRDIKEQVEQGKCGTTVTMNL